jgi:hypothetical protein
MVSNYVDNVDEEEAEDLREFTEARRTVNGVDKQKKIAEYAMAFKKALHAAWITNEEPLKKAPEVPVGGAVAAGGAIVLIEPVKDLAVAINAQQNLLSSGSLVKLAIGLAIVAGSLYVLYARWDAAGRPNVFKRGA